MNKLWLIPIAIPILLLGYWVTESYELPSFHTREMTIDKVSDSSNYYLVYGTNGEKVQLDKLWLWEYSLDLPSFVSEVKEKVGQQVAFGCHGFNIGKYEEDRDLYPYGYSDCSTLR